MNHDTTTGPVSETESRPAGPSWRRVIGALLTTLAVVVAGLPVTLGAVLWLSVSVKSYDTSGQGGPFRSCTADSTACDGGDSVGAIISVLLIIGVFIGAGFAGQGVLRWPSNAAGRWLMAGFAVVVTVIVAVIVLLMLNPWLFYTAAQH
ncbi:hypothetical protein [Agromyces sp. Root81]|uniref:hypothetical protein n=1 Tax=Agromyces sp. Root81 TaxID=1736601 RepID=UPI0012F7BB27|nr:hypothetical protein [Agromyces sp. Root81]